MKAVRTAEEFLQDILTWADHIAAHLNGVDYEEFQESLLLQHAVTKCVENIGEAAMRAARLDPFLRTGHPDFKVDMAYRARNVAAHGYFDVDFDVVWDTAQYSVPEMAHVVRRILSDRAKGRPE